jgi:2-polyprenyl-3-methyl-5-hydroxy-6-metoxy-1,4-benzoquinol methylase
MFRNYLYVSGTTSTLASYFEDFVLRTERDLNAGRPLRVLDIASNDGSLLEAFRRRGHEVVGVDPAENLRALSEAKGIFTVVSYWNEDALRQSGGAFDVVVAMNVLAHIPTPLEFLRLCARAVRPGGRIYIQTSQAKMVEHGEFDTIYHEHHSFFTVRSFMALAARAGLAIADIRHVPVHGISYLVQFTPDTAATRSTADDFEIGRHETSAGYYDVMTYRRFARRALEIRNDLSEILANSRAAGYRLAGYGAAAKGMTLLNFARLDLDYIVDDNRMKIGLLTPGRNIPVVGPEHLETDPASTVFLILAWNFRDEIMRRIRARRHDDSDRYLTCFPRVVLAE